MPFSLLRTIWDLERVLATNLFLWKPGNLLEGRASTLVATRTTGPGQCGQQIVLCSADTVELIDIQYTVYLYKVLLFRLPKYKTRTSGPGQCGQQIVHSADTMDTVQCNVMHCNAQKISLSCTLKYRVWLPQYRSRTKHSAKPIYNAEYD